MMIFAYIFLIPLRIQSVKSQKGTKKSCCSIIKLKETTIIKSEYNYLYDPY